MYCYKKKDEDWRLWSVLISLIDSNKYSCCNLLFWLLIKFGIQSISTYLTVGFLSSASIRILTLLLVTKSLESLVKLRTRLAQKEFMLEFIRRLHSLIYTRLLSTDWHRLKLADHEQMRRKVDEACNSVQFLIENIIDEISGFWNLTMAILTVAILCPWYTTISLTLVYVAFFFGYVRQHGREFLKFRIEANKKSEQLQEKCSRTASRTLDYVLHGERIALVTNTASFHVAIECIWYAVDYAADRLSFAEELLGKICTLVTIGVLVINNDNPLIAIPLYHYLASLVDQLDNTNQIIIRCTRLIKEYDLILPMLDEYESRFEAPQYKMRKSLTIHALHFSYEEQTKQRTRFELKLSQPLLFQHGDIVLITGNSGAGKSTFYDILSGCISNKRYKARIMIDETIELPNGFHNIESLRTVVLQDTQMDFRSSIYTMITDSEYDCQSVISREDEERIWYFLRLVEIDSFVRDNLGGELYHPLENRLSGGQKTRLMLARALNRAEQRQSQILILDEPDRGLPSETTFRIMSNIVRWFKPKGILFLTLHNDRVRERLFVNHLLHIDHGYIRSIPFDRVQRDSPI